MRHALARLLVGVLLVLLLVACAGGYANESQESPPASGVNETTEGESVEVTRVVEDEAAETAGGGAAATALPGATAEPQEHQAEVEWPTEMRMGESDVVRLSLLPVADGYVITADFPEHRTVTETVQVTENPGYDVVAGARLDGVGFELAPLGDQWQDWQPGQALHWRWTVSPERSGQQRLSVNLVLQWRPEPGRSLASRQVTLFSRALNVQVLDPPGWGAGWTLALGFGALLLGILLGVPYLRRRGAGRHASVVAGPEEVEPPEDLVLEPHPDIQLNGEDDRLLRALFRGYARTALEQEFVSGYSGARTFLALPIRSDGRADAYSVAKLGEREEILREYQNYTAHVEHTLPPVTARIQGRPVALRGKNGPSGRVRAGLRYTFVGAPGQQPVSLKAYLCAGGDVGVIEQLLRMFGPGWWMQRWPHTFRLGAEYDRKLPAHYKLIPAEGTGVPLDGLRPAPVRELQIGDVVTPRGVEVTGRKEPDAQEGQALLTLCGKGQNGGPALRLYWQGETWTPGQAGRVVETRAGMLRHRTAGFERYGLPDPLTALPGILAESVSGTRAIIHGDLNLQNALVGPGELVWLIDFAETREGHTLYDFAHLGADIVAHVLPARYARAEEYVAALADDGEPLLATLQRVAQRCLFDPQQPREYTLALYVSCLGALKHRNVDARGRHFLYLTAAYLLQQLT